MVPWSEKYRKNSSTSKWPHKSYNRQYITPTYEQDGSELNLIWEDMFASSHSYTHELLQLSNNGNEIRMWETEGFIIQKALSSQLLRKVQGGSPDVAVIEACSKTPTAS